MSLEKNPETNDVMLPDADPVDVPEAKAKRSMLTPSAKFGLLIVGAFAVIGGGIFWTTQQELAASAVSRAPSLDATPGGDVQAGSPEYQDSVRALNERRAALAAERGITSMPTPEVILAEERQDDVGSVEIEIPAVPEGRVIADVAPEPQARVAERRILPAPPPAPRVEAVQVSEEPRQAVVASASSAGAEEPENPFIAKMIGQMSTTGQRFQPKPMSSQSAQARDEGEDAAGRDAGGSPAIADRSAPSSPDLLFRPGDIIYAETLTSVNSDMQSPVLAEVVAGPHKGARLTGSFQSVQGSDRLVVSFNAMTLKDGTALSVDAFAVDGRSAETAVASDVERRYVARYGPILASSFLTGYAQAASRAGTTISGVGDAAQIVQDESTAEQNLLAGVAAATMAVAGDIAAMAPKGPKIILRDGWPIGILFVAPVEAAGSSPTSLIPDLPALSAPAN